MMKPAVAILTCGLLLSAATSSDVELAAQSPAQNNTAAARWPKYEHFAFCCVEGYLDGPSKEAMSAVTKAASVDDEGNLYFVPAQGDGCLRVARIDGTVQTIAGADYWQGSLPAEEGPAAFIPHLQRAGGIGNPVSTCVAVGSPLKDGPDGQPLGYLITRGGHGTGLDNAIYKIWRNKEKGGRWWFRIIAGTGTNLPPTTVGQSVPAKNVRFPRLPFVNKRELANGKTEVVLHSEGNVWVYDDRQGTLTCVLTASQYMGAEVWKTLRQGRPVTQPPQRMGFWPDGSFILNTYQETYPIGCVLKVTPDGKQVELLATNPRGSVDKAFDGDALNQTAFFGGPLLAGGGAYPQGVVLLTAVDDALLRRLKDGRVATLCKDGEWREFPTKRAAGGGELTWQECPADKAPAWGRGWVMAPGGYFYQLYSMGGGDAWVWRVGPIDWNKPTLQKLP
ncbi:hypothetical protein HRbin36_01707 [bacterium HR36]|nr:hypothetical protein HRbin36_01707 [bacterium HR36]